MASVSRGIPPVTCVVLAWDIPRTSWLEEEGGSMLRELQPQPSGTFCERGDGADTNVLHHSLRFSRTSRSSPSYRSDLGAKFWILP